MNGYHVHANGDAKAAIVIVLVLGALLIISIARSK